MNKNISILIVFIIIVLNIGDCTQAQQAGPSELPSDQEIYNDSPFGIHPANIFNSFSEALDMGVKWNRSSIYMLWFKVQKNLNEDTYDFSIYDTYYGSVPDEIKILTNIIPDNPRNPVVSNFNYLSPDSYLPIDEEKYLKFVKAAVERYDGDGIDDMPGLTNPVMYWQVGNEPNDRSGFGGFARLQKITYEAIKSACPQCKVLVGGVAQPMVLGEFTTDKNGYFSDFSQTYEPYLEELNGSGFDIFDFHWYGDANGDYANIKPIYDELKLMLNNYNFNNVDIWITEMGAYSGTPTSFPFYQCQTEKQQAADYLKRFIYSLSLGAKKIFPAFGLIEGFRNNDGYFDHTGFIYDGKGSDDLGSGVKKLAYYTYKKMTETLEGADWNNIQTIQESDGLYVYKVIKNGKNIWVAWNDSNTKNIEINTGSAQQVKITEVVPKYITGKDVSDYNSAFNTEIKIVNGTVDLILGDVPVFLEHYQSDTTAPAQVNTLVTSNLQQTSITLTWTSVGDDGTTGTATSYDIRYLAGTPITSSNFSSAIQCTGEPTPKAAGNSETFIVNGLTTDTTYYFAMKVLDEVPNTGVLSNVASDKTASIPPLDMPPTVSITAPANNATVSGSVTVTATASDDNGISKVCFYVDNIIKSTNTISPYTYNLNTTGYSDGIHTIKAVVTDTNAQNTNAQISVTINNAPPPDDPPTVAITSPVNGDTISGTIAIAATATDDNGISKVCFYIDDVLKSTDIASPFAYNLNTTGYANGVHTIKAVATDTASQTVNAQISVTINNVAPVDNPPTVAITAPANNATISGSVTITATATDDNGVSKVCFYLDNIIKSTDTIMPYTYNLDTTGYTNGTHIIKAIVTDTNAQTTTAQIIVTVNNVALDNPPAVSIISPVNGDTISGSVSVTATVTDDNGISKVCFYIDNLIKSTDTAFPYAYNLDTTGYTNGVHTIKAITTDTIGQTAITEISVNVDNTPPVDNPPTINIVTPNNNSEISGIVAIEGTATDDNGVASVAFYVDDILKNIDITSPYAYTLDTTGYSDGSHTIKVVATDTASQTVNAQVSITINNAPSADTIAPSSINNLSVVDKTPTTITVSWTSVGDDGTTGTAASYDIRYVAGTPLTVSNFATAIQVTGEPTPKASGNSESITISNLTANTTYYIGMKVADEVPNTGGLSNIINVKTQPMPIINTTIPNTISYLTASSLPDRKIQLNWLGESTSTAAVSGYNIYMASGSNSMNYNTAYKTIAGNSTSTTIEGLTADREYRFVVRSVDANGNEDTNTSVISATAVEEYNLNMLTIGSLASGMKISGTEVTLSADSILGDVSSLSAVRFEYKKAGDTNWTEITTDTNYPYYVQWDTSKLDVNAQYYVRIVSVDTDGIEDTTFGYITVKIDNINPDIIERAKYKKMRLDNRRRNVVRIGMPNSNLISEVIVSSGILNSMISTMTIELEPSDAPEIGRNFALVGYVHKIEIEGQSQFNTNGIEIRIQYPDENKDGRVDGLDINGSKLIICTYNTEKGKWEKVSGSASDTTNKTVTIKTNHLSYYAVFATLQSDLSVAHVYPNPFKPSLGHTKIIFANLTSHTKVKVFNMAGEIVYEEDRDTPTGELSWDVVNTKNKAIVSGVYIYMITNNNGQMKKGKLAIIR